MRILGMGNALVDILAPLKSDDCIEESGLIKGGMELIDEDRLLKIMNLFTTFDTTNACGGSGANSISGLSCMGVTTGYIGKVGTDSYGQFFCDDLKKNGCVPYLNESNLATGCAMTFISPDGERTFGTYLGAAATLMAEDLNTEIFSGYDLLYIEGYLIQNHDLIREAIKLARKNQMKIAVDMASFNIVKHQLPICQELVSNTDILFANEDEAFAFTGKQPEEAAKELGKICEIAVVKCGKNGSIIVSGDQFIKIGIIEADCIDTTGAGDLYAAGFLYGLSQNLSLEESGKIGAILSGNVIEIIGTKMDSDRWNKIKLKVNELLGK